MMDNSGHHERSIINRIMLGFRPIAPKPVAAHSASSQSGGGMKADRIAESSGKRKYIPFKKTTTTGCKRNKKIVVQDKESKKDTMKNSTAVTLELLPGSGPDDVQKYEQATPMITRVVQDNPLALDVRVVESWVIVESVTDTCMDSLGETDQEKVRNLEVDTCPGFISDCCNRVQWVNDAYKSMVMMSDNDNDDKKKQQQQQQPLELRVGLLMKENMEILSKVAAFTCQVKLQYTWQNGKCSEMVPCDVWRMEFGGFAWRLDIKTALRLGR